MVSLLLSFPYRSLINVLELQEQEQEQEPELPQEQEQELELELELPQELEPEPVEPPPFSGNQWLRPKTMPLLAQEEKTKTYAYLITSFLLQILFFSTITASY